MEVQLNGTGKKYYREWIFRKLKYSINSGQKLAILGPNGSGKSTLLQVVSGAVIPNEGDIKHHFDGKTVSPDEVYKHISFAAPYIELIEEFTLEEIINFHFRFKTTVNLYNPNEIIEMTGLAGKSKQVFKYYSSGMKQRIKLALALFSDTPLLLLDEPCSNLDSQGIEWYKRNINEFAKNRTVVVASNQNKDEYSFCDSEINIKDYKNENSQE